MHQQAPCVNDGTVDVCLLCTKTLKSQLFVSMPHLYSLYLHVQRGKTEGNHYLPQVPNSLFSKV
jgi:hypothetical protein